jgi:hypothetical protein
MAKQVRLRKPVQLYVEEEIRVKIEQAAQTAGLTVSTYLANLLRDHFQGVPVQPDPLRRLADLERRVAALEERADATAGGKRHAAAGSQPGAAPKGRAGARRRSGNGA